MTKSESSTFDTRASVIASLRFLALKAEGAAQLATIHAKKYGELLTRAAKEFESNADSAREMLRQEGKGLGWQDPWQRIGMAIWGRVSRLATRKFCLEMADHLARKMVLQLDSISRRSEASGLDFSGFDLEARLASLHELSEELQSQAQEASKRP